MRLPCVCRGMGQCVQADPYHALLPCHTCACARCMPTACLHTHGRMLAVHVCTWMSASHVHVMFFPSPLLDASFFTPAASAAPPSATQTEDVKASEVAVALGTARATYDFGLANDPANEIQYLHFKVGDLITVYDQVRTGEEAAEGRTARADHVRCTMCDVHMSMPMPMFMFHVPCVRVMNGGSVKSVMMQASFHPTMST